VIGSLQTVFNFDVTELVTQPLLFSIFSFHFFLSFFTLHVDCPGEIRHENVEWMNLAQDMDQWRTDGNLQYRTDGFYNRGTVAEMFHISYSILGA